MVTGASGRGRSPNPRTQPPTKPQPGPAHLRRTPPPPACCSPQPFRAGVVGARGDPGNTERGSRSPHRRTVPGLAPPLHPGEGEPGEARVRGLSQSLLSAAFRVKAPELEAYPNKIKRQPGDTDYLTSRCTYRTWRRHESRNRPVRSRLTWGAAAGGSHLGLRPSIPICTATSAGRLGPGE